jgi:hypothetical protein
MNPRELIESEINGEISQLQESRNKLESQIAKSELESRRFRHIIEKLKLGRISAVFTDFTDLFEFPTYSQTLKKSERDLAQTFRGRGSRCSSGIVCREFLISQKMAIRRNYKIQLDASINNLKPIKHRIAKCNVNLANIQTSANEAIRHLCGERRKHIQKLIDANASFGYEKLRGLYKYLEDGGIQLIAESHLYFDTLGIKNMLKELASLRARELAESIELNSLRSELITPNQQQQHITTKSQTCALSRNPIIYKSNELLANFESTLATIFIRKLNASIAEIHQERETMVDARAIDDAGISALQTKFSRIAYLPEVRRMLAYSMKTDSH